MRRVMIPVGLLAASVAVAAPVLAQSSGSNTSNTVLTTKVSVSPSKAGTKKKPQGVKLTFKVHWETAADVDKPVVQTADVLFPKGSLYNGAKYAKCAQSVMERGSVSDCPPKSIMGTGSGTAYADQVLTQPEDHRRQRRRQQGLPVHGADEPGARRQAGPRHDHQACRASGPTSSISTVPQSLQVVAGVPIALRDIKITAGGKSYAKDWLATTSCSGGKYPFQLTTGFAPDSAGAPVGEATYAGSTPCSK